MILEQGFKVIMYMILLPRFFWGGGGGRFPRFHNPQYETLDFVSVVSLWYKQPRFATCVDLLPSLDI